TIAVGVVLTAAGKGAAIRSALSHATGEVIVIQDADLEYNPADIEQVIRPILAGEADVAFGSRFAVRPTDAGSSDWARRLHRAANWLLTWLSNRSTGLRLTDMEMCYKAMRRDVAAGLVLREDRFGFEPEFTAKIARGGWRVVEVPVSYCPRNRAAGKKIGLADGIRTLWCIVRYAWRD
ncbi:MAG TPA: glycosyltransferase family 2 protein, partial [Lacipirellulaceae bacterium]|nr:glycosyltransferase family 2 protein [Lacipirellulaceae bacterium]